MVTETHSGTYSSWKKMVARCCNPKHVSFARYGGRGITVCKEWMTFANFLRDMGERPDRHEIDRLDNDRGYEKTNCRWTQNSGRKARIGYRGVTKTRNGRWTAQITKDHKTYCLGTANTPDEAALLYNAAAARLYGLTARLNKVDES